MFNPMLLMLNQQLGQAIALGQRGMMAETAGNPQYAAQCYDQSIVLIQQGNTTIAQQYYSAVQGMMPGGPPMPTPPAAIAGAPGRAWGASGAAGPTDWLKTIDQVLGTAQAVFKTIGGFNDMMKTFDR